MIFTFFFIVGSGEVNKVIAITDKAAEDNIKALNHFNISLYKITHYNNKAVLDEEYDTINNDLKLDSVGDRKLVEIIQKLMDALTDSKISEIERERMQTVFQKMQEELIINMLQEGGKSIVIEGGKFTKYGPVGMAIGMMASVPSIVSSTRKPIENMAIQKQKIDNFNWELDIKKLKSLNELNKEFLTTYWEFLHNSNVPDALRISEKQIAILIDINNEKDIEKNTVC